jgi:hypothetical protein
VVATIDSDSADDDDNHDDDDADDGAGGGDVDAAELAVKAGAAVGDGADGGGEGECVVGDGFGD